MLTPFVEKIHERYRNSLLLRSGFWYLIGRSLVKGINVLSIAIFTRLLTPEQYATITIFLMWVSIFDTIGTLNMETAVYQARFEFEDESYQKYVSASMFLGMISSSVVLLIVVLLPDSFIGGLFSLSKWQILLILLIMMLSLGFRIKLFVWEAALKYGPNIRMTLFVEISSLILSVVLILAPSAYDPASGRILGYAAANIIPGVIYGIGILGRGREFVNVRYWRHALVFAVPIIPHMLANMILTAFDRVLIDHYIGRAEAGVYSLAYQVGTILLFIWSAFQSAWTPWVYSQLKERNYAIIRLRTRQYILVFSALTVLIVTASPIAVRLLSPAPYWEAIGIVPLIASGYFFVFLYGFYANIEFYTRKTGYISLATILAALINIILNMIFLPRYGYVFAAWATLISYFCMFLFHAAIVRFRIDIENVNDFRLMLVAGGCITVLSTALYLFVW